MITNTELTNYGNIFPAVLGRYEHVLDTITFFSANGVILRLQVLRDSVLRFKYGTSGKLLDDFSYAVDVYANKGYNKLKVTETATYIEITTSKIICQISKTDLRSRIFDIDGKIICEDELGFHYEESYEKSG